MKTTARRLASHVPTRTPLVLPIRPPAPPAPPPAKPAAAAGRPGQSSSAKPAGASSSGPTSSTIPKPRLDLAKLLANLDYTRENYILRRSPLGPDHLAHLSRLRDTQLLLIQKLQSIRAKQREVGELIRSKLGDGEQLVLQAKKLKTRIKEYEINLAATEEELDELALALPNFTHPDVPVGPEEHAVELETFGPRPVEADSDRDHLRIAQHFGLVDTEASAVATGSSWPFLRGELALLELALVNYSLSIAIKHGFEPVIPPDVVKTDLAWRCGFAPRDTAASGPQQTYFLSSDGAASPAPNASSSSSANSKDKPAPTHCLAGTSEIPLAALFANKVYAASALPQKVVGAGHAFRAEAGARGADTRGLYRVHQFTKVELFAVTEEGAASEEMMETMRAVQKEVAQGLGLSVRLLDMPTEELGAPAVRKYDMEAWMPGRGKWGEITSTSNCTDFQSRRLHTRYRRPHRATEASAPEQASATSPAEGLAFAHTLNGTCAAIPRLLVALLENGARFGSATAADGGKEIVGLDLPKALQRYWVGGETVGKAQRQGQLRWV